MDKHFIELEQDNSKCLSDVREHTNTQLDKIMKLFGILKLNSMNRNTKENRT